MPILPRKRHRFCRLGRPAPCCPGPNVSGIRSGRDPMLEKAVAAVPDGASAAANTGRQNNRLDCISSARRAQPNGPCADGRSGMPGDLPRSHLKAASPFLSDCYGEWPMSQTGSSADSVSVLPRATLAHALGYNVSDHDFSEKRPTTRQCRGPPVRQVHGWLALLDLNASSRIQRCATSRSWLASLTWR
jgi:hypothetical protein